jgi:hypothetical protein
MDFHTIGGRPIRGRSDPPCARWFPGVRVEFIGPSPQNKSFVALHHDPYHSLREEWKKELTWDTRSNASTTPLSTR